ncbi:MAG: hypothetical protein J6Q39_07775 [Bacteroidales bacterium]|nr:hypothetical protein [Bacteroidales bacterium]
MNKRTPLDIYEVEMMPAAMKAYLRNHGYSFSKKACDFAVSLMERKNKATDKTEKIEPYTKEKTEELLTKYGVSLKNNIGYNFVYVINKYFADCWKESIDDEQHLAKHVKCIIDDIDNNPENIFRMWIAKMDGNGIPIPWEDIM